MLNAFTVDLEDWYQGLEIDSSAWQGYEDRIESATSNLLALLDDYHVQATFFILGYVAERHPGLVRQIAALGHEIGSHGCSHKFLYRLSPVQLKQELQRCRKILEDITGDKVESFRAPFFSITKDSIWALEILAQEGFLYDSSIFPVHNYRYGLPSAPNVPFQISFGSNGAIQEFPISTIKIGKINFPFSGGAYFRIFPYQLSRYCIRRVNQRQIPVMFYIHPWELDPDHPRIRLPKRISITHYANLDTTKKKLEKLLAEVRFTTLKQTLQNGTKGPVIFPENLR